MTNTAEHGIYSQPEQCPGNRHRGCEKPGARPDAAQKPPQLYQLRTREGSRPSRARGLLWHSHHAASVPPAVAWEPWRSGRRRGGGVCALPTNRWTRLSRESGSWALASWWANGSSRHIAGWCALADALGVRVRPLVQCPAPSPTGIRQCSPAGPTALGDRCRHSRFTRQDDNQP